MTKRAKKTTKKVVKKSSPAITLVTLIVIGIRQVLDVSTIPDGPFVIASYGANMDFFNFDFFKKYHSQIISISSTGTGYMPRRTEKVGDKFVSELKSEPGALLEEVNTALEPLGFKVGKVVNGLDSKNPASKCLDHVVINAEALV